MLLMELTSKLANQMIHCNTALCLISAYSVILGHHLCPRCDDLGILDRSCWSINVTRGRLGPMMALSEWSIRRSPWPYPDPEKVGPEIGLGGINPPLVCSANEVQP